MSRYKYYQAENKVIAISSYAGRRVKGIAKCDPNDEFDYEKGKKLATARCDEKIAFKRVKRATEKYIAAKEAVYEARDKFERMKEYYIDSVDAYDKIADELIEMKENF